MVIGLAMVILIIQLATLTNLLQNEVKPLLESTNETANTLRGTAAFLSENLTEPVIKLNEYLSGIRRLLKWQAFFGNVSQQNDQNYRTVTILRNLKEVSMAKQWRFGSFWRDSGRWIDRQQRCYGAVIRKNLRHNQKQY
jgi:hypothetical protein